MSDLSEMVELVSGAARGIGAAIGQRMVDHRAKFAEEQVFDRQALAASVHGRPSVD